MFSLAKLVLFVLLWPKSTHRTGWIGSKLTSDPGGSSTEALSKLREKHTWAWGCGSHVQRELNPTLTLTPWMARPFSAFHTWVTFPFSRQVSLYPRPMWWAHVPEGPSAQSFTLSAAHIVWLEMNRQGILAGKGVILPEGETELVVGCFRVSWGFVGIPYSFVISSSWELGDIRGESWVAGGVGYAWQ